MRRLALARPEGEPLRILALGCHSDDIEIGCGGTLLRLLAEQPAPVEVWWVVLSARAERGHEARASAEAFLAGATERTLVLGDHRDGFFPVARQEIKELFEELKGQVSPDVIFTHCRHDSHQDHRLACELTWNTFRNHLILEYEVPKYDGDLGQPNVFVELSEETCRRKVDELMRHFGSQLGKHWFTDDVFLALMRLRGLEAASSTRYAEAFHGRKVVM